MARTRGRTVAAATLCAVVWLGMGHVSAGPAEPQTPPKIQVKPAMERVGIEGKETFAAYCAGCHGTDGKGHGPAAPALKMPVLDLTTLSARPGCFNEVALQHAILGSDRMPAAHGTMTMPVWGPVFRATDGAPADQLRIKNLVDYVKGLQAKS